ncbi:MAG: hypothetical protein NTU81_01305 [Candidatus Nomurabacteria bacterium]|nr:hypothetical protein [Candidatus Nomurabacteria bacterium]
MKNKAKISKKEQPKEEELPQEGSGFSFTEWQINTYGLNPDSY